MTDQQTVTKTRTEINVEEVEETLYLCRNCGLEYEEHEVAKVAIDVNDSGMYYDSSQLCHACLESVLGYDASSWNGRKRMRVAWENAKGDYSLGNRIIGVLYLSAVVLALSLIISDAGVDILPFAVAAIAFLASMFVNECIDG